MASGEIVLGGLLSLIEVNADNQNHQEIAKDDNVVRRSEAKSRHTRLPGAPAAIAFGPFDTMKHILTLTNAQSPI
jgi:hypothetical protein